ncbi:MAG: Fe-S cluster assembly protein SufD [Verrucomicrobiaceae bacterium]|nr:Fe-S cluster assembly protein SufD [Verrucomicrobiaceae bacterium]
MSEALLEEKSVKRSFFDDPEGVDKNLPDWYTEARAAAWREYNEAPWPKRTHEAWRFADLKKLAFDDIVDAVETDGAELITRSTALEENAGRIILANDRLIADPLLDAELEEKGVIFKPLSRALVEDADLIRLSFMQEPARLGSSKFSALHRARLREGIFLHIPKDVSLSRPVEVFHWLSGENAAIFPHSLIVSGAGSSAAIAEYVASAGQLPGFCGGVTDLVAGENAKLTHVRTQNLSEQAHSLHVSSSLAAAGANIRSFILNLGCHWSRSEFTARLSGEGASTDMLAVCLPENSQEMDMRTLQLHEQEHTTSNLLYKNALYDEARTIFAGLIMVEEGAHHTDAFQTCRNLLMSDQCEANSMPGLEINTDQVKCSHGSTSGPITDEELFYLRARGIPESAARQLMTFGFVKGAVDGIGHDALEKVILEKIDRRFRRILT